MTPGDMPCGVREAPAVIPRLQRADLFCEAVEVYIECVSMVFCGYMARVSSEGR